MACKERMCEMIKLFVRFFDLMGRGGVATPFFRS
jgi:hypothetical protein